MKPDLFAMSASKHKSVSYRRNRDYSKQFNWTFELNQDLYECYTEARKVPEKGYMARMKKYPIHSSYCHVPLITTTVSINVEFMKGYDINLGM